MEKVFCRLWRPRLVEIAPTEQCLPYAHVTSSTTSSALQINKIAPLHSGIGYISISHPLTSLKDCSCTGGCVVFLSIMWNVVEMLLFRRFALYCSGLMCRFPSMDVPSWGITPNFVDTPHPPVPPPLARICNFSMLCGPCVYSFTIGINIGVSIVWSKAKIFCNETHFCGNTLKIQKSSWRFLTSQCLTVASRSADCLLSPTLKCIIR